MDESTFLVYLASGLLIFSYALVGFGIINRATQWKSITSNSRAIIIVVIFIYLVSVSGLIEIVNQLFKLIC
ncbi:hypothetical protein BZG82_11365, partial [Salinivibrio sp. PR5]|uniref:hypothetical protein n=1 Tax=Salinivibrio sp. PR5 TaxID=1909484 RepID=UPI0009CAB4EE